MSADFSTGLEGKTVGEVCEWLKEKAAIPDSVLDIFKDEEMDGSAISAGLATCPGPDWLKDVVAKVGLRLKIHNALRTLYNETQPIIPPSRAISHQQCSAISPSSSSSGWSSVKATASEYAESTNFSDASPTIPVRVQIKKEELFPKSFPIPKFRAGTEENFERKILTDSDRKYVVQTLATMLMAHVSKPSLKQCGLVAKCLIQKFDFLKDGEGDGEHSWKWFIYYRCQNVNRDVARKRSDGGPPKKRVRVDQRAMHSYAPTHAEDAVSHERNLKLLRDELCKSKPRIDVLKNLMQRTFSNRFDALVNGTEVVTALDQVEKFPLLRKAAYVSQEFCCVVSCENIRDTFEQNFPKWAHAIIRYCKDTQIKCSALQHECEGYAEDMDDEHLAVMALRCLALLFIPMKPKKLDDDIPFMLKVVPRGTPTSEATFKSNNQPHIVMFRNEEDSELLQQYFIIVEQQLMMECSTTIAAIFFCMAAHYIFNLAYHPKVKDVWLFLQEKVFNLPSRERTGVKYSPSSTTHFSGICRVFAAFEAEEACGGDEDIEI